MHLGYPLLCKKSLFALILFFSASIVYGANVEVQVLGKGGVIGAGQYDIGQQATLQAEPGTGFVFKGWSGDLAGSDNPVTFSVSGDLKIKAHFEVVETKTIIVNGQRAAAGRYVGKLNEQGRRSLKRRVNRVGSTTVFRRNKVLDDLVSIQWDTDVSLKDELNSDTLSAGALEQISKQRSDLKAMGFKSEVKNMMDSGNYEYVEPDWLLSLNATPSDDGFTNGSLWGLQNLGSNLPWFENGGFRHPYIIGDSLTGVSGTDTNITDAWDLTTGSEDIIVAVIDTGVRYTHNDLAANMWNNPDEIPDNGVDDDGNGYVDDVYGISAQRNGHVHGDPMDDNGHGTHCAGTISAVANGGGPAVGVAWSSKIMALKFMHGNGGGYSSDAVTCIDYAIAKGARVINASYGGGGPSAYSKNAITRAMDAGIVFVAAAGNNSSNNDRFQQYPANYEVDNIISVAAIDRAGNLANFSNYGKKSVDIGAPGVSIFSTYHLSDTSYKYLQGTSMAAPHVAGVAALLLAREPELTPAEVRERLLATSSPLSSLSGKTLSGGMVNTYGALLAAPKVEISMEVTYSPEEVEKDGPMVISARLSAPRPLLGASVSAIMDEETFVMLDNGRGEDKKADDGIYTVETFAPNLLSFDLVVQATASGYEPAEATLPVQAFIRPPNDSFARATPLASSISETTGTNKRASLEAGEQAIMFESQITHTVWYTWQPTRSGQANLDTFGSEFDTTLAAYTGDSIDTLNLVASNDDASSDGFTSAIQFDAEEGQKYYLQIGGVRGAQGKLVLRHPQPEEKAPEEPVLDPPIILTKGIDLTKTEGDFLELVVEAVGSPPLKYQWLMNGGRIVGAEQSSYALPFLALEDAGQYSVLVTNEVDFATAQIANLSVRKTKDKPLNDDIENAEVLEGEDISGRALNRKATGQAGEPNHAGNSNPQRSVWWKWTAPRTGTVRANTTGSTFDTTLAAYQLASESNSTRRSGTVVPPPKQVKP